MILKANTFGGQLDISSPEQMDGNNISVVYRRSMVSGQTLWVPDAYYAFPNIMNAVNLGLLTIVQFDSKQQYPAELVIKAAETGGGGGTPVSPVMDFQTIQASVTVNSQVVTAANVIPADSFILSIQVKITSVDGSVSYIDVGDQQGQQKYAAGVPVTLEVQRGMLGQQAPFMTAGAQDVVITCNAAPSTGFTVLVIVSYMTDVMAESQGLNFNTTSTALSIYSKTTTSLGVLPANSFILDVQTLVTATDPNVLSFDVGDQQSSQKYAIATAATLNNQKGMLGQQAPFMTYGAQDVIITCNAAPAASLGLTLIVFYMSDNVN